MRRRGLRKLKGFKNLINILMVIFPVAGLLLGIALMNSQAGATSSALSGGCGNIFFGDTTNAGIMRSRSFSASSGTCTSTWAAEINGITGSASNILHVVAKTAPTREEMMIGSLRVNGTLQIESCTTACDANGDFTNRWAATFVSGTQDCDTAPTLGSCNRAFDIAYESLNGKAMVVYAGDSDANSTTDTDKVYYAEWNNSAWSPDSSPNTPSATNQLDLPGTGGTPRWIRVVAAGDNLADDRSNRLMLLVADSDDDLYAFYWDGSSWDSGSEVFTTLANCDRARCFDGNWQGNNVFVVSYSNSGQNEIRYQTYTVGSGWGSDTQAYTTSSVGAWVESKADPTSSRVYVTTAAVGEDTRGAVWRADDATNGWTVCNNSNPNCPDTAIETVGGQQASSSFERFSGEAVHAYNDSGNGASTQDAFYTYTPTSTWANQSTTFNHSVTDDPNAMLTWTNPSNDDIMSISVDWDCDIDADQWNGSSWDTGAANLEASSSFPGVACPGTATPTDGTASWGFDFTWKMYTPWQRNWRWFPGTDTASTPSTGTALAAENTAPTGIAPGQDVRLRINYAERGRAISNNDARKKLQFTSGCNPNSALETTCTWTDVDDPGGTGLWRYLADGDIACTATDCDDGTTLVGTVLTGTSTCTAGLGCGTWVGDKDAAAGTAMDHTAQSSADTIQESEYIIEPNGAAGETTYYFRIYDVDQDTPMYREQDANDCQPSGTSACTYPSLTTLKLDQLHYRWRSDDGNETTGTSLVSEDTALTGATQSTNYRLRFLVNNTGGAAGNINYRLDWAARVGGACDTDETYATVPDSPTSEPFDMVATTHYADGTNSTNVASGPGILSNPSGTFQAGKLVESTSNSTGNINMVNDNYTEIEYALQPNSNATALGNYCLRVSHIGTPLSTYSVYAAIQMAVGGPTTDQVLRHGTWFNGGAEQSYFWSQ